MNWTYLKSRNFHAWQVHIRSFFNYGIELVRHRAGTLMPGKFRFTPFHLQNWQTHTCIHANTLKTEFAYSNFPPLLKLSWTLAGIRHLLASLSLTDVLINLGCSKQCQRKERNWSSSRWWKRGQARKKKIKLWLLNQVSVLFSFLCRHTENTCSAVPATQPSNLVSLSLLHGLCSENTKCIVELN